jgi:hypothetical protein
MTDYTKMTEENMKEFLKAKAAIQDYITFLVVKRKITKTTKELSSHLSNLIQDSILTWSDPNE